VNKYTISLIRQGCSPNLSQSWVPFYANSAGEVRFHQQNPVVHAVTKEKEIDINCLYLYYFPYLTFAFIVFLTALTWFKEFLKKRVCLIKKKSYFRLFFSEHIKHSYLKFSLVTNDQNNNLFASTCHFVIRGNKSYCINCLSMGSQSFFITRFMLMSCFSRQFYDILVYTKTLFVYYFL